MGIVRHFVDRTARLASLACLTLLSAPAATSAALPLAQIQLPPGFRIEVLSDEVPNARGMALTPSGTLFVGTQEGKVYALPSALGGKPVVRVVASGLARPVGVAFRDGSLYASSTSRIVRLDNIEARLDHPPTPVVVTDRFPKETTHGWKFIAFGPDGYLYVPVGAPCNICAPDENRYANIMKMKPDGSDLQVVARGVRNSVGFDWHPATHELWFTDNGRDYLGDDQPDDELNRVTQAGQHFGYPFCHAGNIPDPEFGKQRACSEFVPPVAKLGAHVAALGMRFYTGTQFPAEYRNNIFIAEHGSWNRSERVGYRIVRVIVDAQGKAVRQEIFAQGWLQHGKFWGRPVDVLAAPDGSLLVSDDDAGAIYRIRYAP
ncbi:sorbosone dehydrogenase family protein [Cupriavidus sp. WKF15]|uniref:PQQ-dependent sugar dehydrogenase n=1 Tax=Cupriavidus sp. WKF15 TaxID=3032282 RepID=UPI0023E330EA|nr:sorbosone dehydrogenase family protein [Cupriavidus sp. WKF15]WER46802.1 sorbosone dehydrogenase family protein [Cupriavidus sp. WKF15]